VANVSDLVRGLNEAIEGQDWETLRQHVHPDVVWRHNIGVGSPEEGVYNGRDSVVALYQRILEPWEYMHIVTHEVSDLGGGLVTVTGDLQAKHRGTSAELVTPYVLRLEFQDELLARGEAVSGPGASLPELR
jgi:hypothetical protein